MFTLKNKLTIFLVLVFASILFSCASTDSNPTGIVTEKNAPLWLTDLRAVYPENEYLSAVGYAADRATAESIAISNLTKILKQRVESETHVNQSFQNNLTENDKSIEASVKTTSLIDEIVGIKINETWVAKDKTVYSVATLSKNDVGNHYSKIIEQKEKAINDFLSIVTKNPVTFEGISACEKALALAYENDSYLELLSVINYDIYKRVNLSYESSSAIEVLSEKQNNLMFIGVFVENDIENRLTSAFATSLNKKGFNTKKLTSLSDSELPPYILEATLHFETLPKSTQSNYITVLFTLDGNLKDKNGKIILPWNCIGKEAHLSESQAKTRAIYTLEQKITENYIPLLEKIAQ